VSSPVSKAQEEKVLTEADVVEPLTGQRAGTTEREEQHP